MLSTYSLGVAYGLGWLLIESYVRPMIKVGRMQAHQMKSLWAGYQPLALYLLGSLVLWWASGLGGGLAFLGIGLLSEISLRLAWRSTWAVLVQGATVVGLGLLVGQWGWRWTWQPAWLWTACYGVAVAAPVNQLFHFLFRRFQPENAIDDATIEGAGATIGILERLITGLLLINQNYAALGLVFTAKSIARYDKISKNSAFAEYYLIGSLFSLLAVLVLYQVYQLGFW